MMIKKLPLHLLKKILIVGLLSISVVSADPLFIQLRNKWVGRNPDYINGQIDLMCSEQYWFYEPEEYKYLCNLSYESRQDVINTIYDNECLDLYTPFDDTSLEKFTKKLCNYNHWECRKEVCKILGHFDETPLTRCLYSGKYICDSYSGYFLRKNEETLKNVGLIILGLYLNKNRYMYLYNRSPGIDYTPRYLLHDNKDPETDPIDKIEL